MILKASQRSGAAQLGQHLLKTEENEHVEVHEVRGFMSENVMGAMKEAQAMAKGTRCKQYLFSVSLNPPETENVAIEVFEGALASIEEKLGLQGQPRMVVFHEKEGRRHAHAVSSRTFDYRQCICQSLGFNHSSRNAARGGQRKTPREDAMFRLTKDGLKAKSEAQLRDLFQRATREIASKPRLSATFSNASTALLMIRDELARRNVSPR